MKFFAVQLNRIDSKHQVAEMLLRKATELSMECETLEALDTLEIGRTLYLRFRSDWKDSDIPKLLTSFFPDRSFIIPSLGGYICKVKTRDGVLPFSTMQTVSRTSPIVFRGNAIPYWERQFLKDKAPS